MRRLSGLILMSVALIISSCASNKNKKNGDKTEAPALQKPLDVGTISAKLEVLESFDEASNTMLVKINEVLGYGASTKSVMPDKQLKLTLPDSFDKNSIQSLSAGEEFSAVIKQMPAMMGTSDNKDVWSIVEVITD